MKKNLIMALAAFSLLFTSCSKKNNTPSPVASDVIEYTFSAGASGKYVVNYYDGVSLGSSENVNVPNWSKKVTVPSGTKSAYIFITGGQNPPFVVNNKGTVVIRLNGQTVATGSTLLTSTSTLARASYSYTGN